MEEFRIKTTKNNGEVREVHALNGPKQAGEIYRHTKKYLDKGETVELQKRATNPWETVERASNNE